MNAELQNILGSGGCKLYVTSGTAITCPISTDTIKGFSFLVVSADCTISYADFIYYDKSTSQWVTISGVTEFNKSAYSSYFIGNGYLDDSTLRTGFWNNITFSGGQIAAYTNGLISN